VGGSHSPALTAAAIALVALVTACGSGSSTGPSGRGLTTTRLPLQPTAPVVSGDPQPDVVDFVRAGLTESQTKKIVKECSASAGDIANLGSCPVVLRILESPSSCTSTTLCLDLVRVSGTNAWLVRIRDLRPDRPLCATGPGGLCWQLAVAPKALAPLGLETGSAAASNAGPSTSPSSSQPTASQSVSGAPTSMTSSLTPSP
jgi:hypothetical protein